jgi:hypothetical protein
MSKVCLKDFDLLGFKVRDRVTEFTGVVTSISYDLFGCVQALVTPNVEESRKRGESSWFDSKRLQKISESPVMGIPDFSIEPPGGNDLPILSKY